jgi:hypothetical protein
MKRFVLLALATFAGYVAVMSALVAATAIWAIRDAREWALPLDHGWVVMFGISASMALLGVLGHVATLRRID